MGAKTTADEPVTVYGRNGFPQASRFVFLGFIENMRAAQEIRVIKQLKVLNSQFSF